jgi:ubiquitin-protein ligase
MAYDPTGIFRKGFTKEEVEAILAEMKKVFTENKGEQVSSWSSSGHQATTRFALPADQVIQECIYALELLCPEDYPTDADRTVVSFSNHDNTFC